MKNYAFAILVIVLCIVCGYRLSLFALIGLSITLQNVLNWELKEAQRVYIFLGNAILKVFSSVLLIPMRLLVG